MLSTHPDTIRPDHSGAFVPAPGVLVESPDIARRMATVILRQASDGQPTTLHDFHEASETRELSGDDLRRNLGRAKQIADETVIRQDAADYQPPRESGHVHGIREATVEDELSEASDEVLLDIARGVCGELVTDDAIVGALLQRGLRPAAISRIWSRLTVKIAADVAVLKKPSIGAIAHAAKVV